MQENQESISELIDSATTVKTFAGVNIEIRTAGVYVRGIARLIDDILRILLMLTVLVVMVFIGGLAGAAFSLIAMFLILWFYNIFFEVVYNGVTPGKRIMGLRAVCADGTPIGFVNSLLRSTLLFIDMLPVSYLLGITLMSLTKNRQRLGDIVAGTVVVYDVPKTELTDQSVGETQSFPATLTLEEKMLFVNLQERLDDLSHDRAVELAETLSPVLQSSGEQALEDIEGIARGIRQG